MEEFTKWWVCLLPTGAIILIDNNVLKSFPKNAKPLPIQAGVLCFGGILFSRKVDGKDHSGILRVPFRPQCEPAMCDSGLAGTADASGPAPALNTSCESMQLPQRKNMVANLSGYGRGGR